MKRQPDTTLKTCSIHLQNIHTSDEFALQHWAQTGPRFVPPLSPPTAGIFGDTQSLLFPICKEPQGRAGRGTPGDNGITEEPKDFNLVGICDLAWPAAVPNLGVVIFSDVGEKRTGMGLDFSTLSDLFHLLFTKRPGHSCVFCFYANLMKLFYIHIWEVTF